MRRARMLQPDQSRPRLDFSRLDVNELVQVTTGRVDTPSASDDGLVLTVWLSCNVEQALHHVDIDENSNQVRVTVWYGWHPDAGHVRTPGAVAAGTRRWRHELHLEAPLGARTVVDGASGETRPLHRPGGASDWTGDAWRRRIPRRQI